MNRVNCSRTEEEISVWISILVSRVEIRKGFYKNGISESRVAELQISVLGGMIQSEEALWNLKECQTVGSITEVLKAFKYLRGDISKLWHLNRNRNNPKK